MIILTFLYLLCSIIYAVIAMIIFLNDSKNKLNKIFFFMCMNLAFWAFMNALMNTVSEAETATLFRRYATFCWGTIYCMFLHFFIILTKKEVVLNKSWKLILLYSPAVISIYLYFFSKPVTVSDIVKLSYGWAYLNTTFRGILWDYFLNIYYISYMLIGIFLLGTWGKNTKIKREKKQSKIISVTLIIVLVMGSITDIILPTLGMPLIPPIAIIFTLIPIGGIWYSIKKYRLMNLNPENVVLDVFKIMNEGVIIANQEGIIHSVNKGAEKLLCYDEKQLKDRPIDAIFLEKTDISKINDSNVFELDLLSKNNVSFPVLFSSSVLKDEWGDKFGSVVIFKDLSEIKRVQNKLKDAYDELEIRVQNRTRELSHANKELKNEIDVRISMEERIKKLAFYDYLTNLPNRRFFSDRLNEELFESVRNEMPLAIMFLDLDSFKKINDTMGHAQGDELLKEVAKRLTCTIRKSDTVARVGGDEFLILLKNVTDEHVIEKIAENIINIFKQPFKLDNNEIYVTTSIGIAIYPIDGDDVETLVKNADIAMYRAKENGKNKFELCTPMIKNKVAEVMRLTNNLYYALENNELELYYQPQVNANSGEIVGFEALIRWHHPELGLVSPSDFIPIAEKNGLILKIGEWVLRTACNQNKIWQDLGLINVPMSVNLSVNQFQNVKIVEQIAEILNETGLNPNDLELEITESILMKEIGHITKILNQLRELGVSISIDDFGTEFSSLNYLKQLPIDRIKIAMTFIEGININDKDEAITKAIIGLAKNLKINLIAKGVETDKQLEFLKQWTCDVIQGYYYYKPMTVQQIDKLLKK